MKSTEKQEKTMRSLEMELQELENARLCKVCLIGLQQTRPKKQLSHLATKSMHCVHRKTFAPKSIIHIRTAFILFSEHLK